MWIRSQNGNILTYCQTLGFSEDGYGIVEVTDNGILILGDYETPEQAKCVMDMISQSVGHQVGVFQMPKEVK
ncbi:hypothetical protein [Schnuerera sp.]|uniref:hypothetical protein n=1 Tax=Schnuerera sp. TaxID=2794844 RepID=UPI002B5AC0F5|nr:hypothetical protein [Schnuerera sp.]HSH36066.1 hypothetical protein [Schnuerera sp.]